MGGPRTLVIGEALVDVIQRGENKERRPGGSPANVAVGLARLGQDVTLLCYLGQDDDGELLRSHMAAASVALHPKSDRAPHTSIAEVELDQTGNATYRFSVAWDLPPKLDWDAVDLAHVGSIALILEPGASKLLQLLRDRPERVRLTVDPNIRAAFLPSTRATERFEQFFAVADIVKLSDEDADVLYPGRDIDEVVQRIRAIGPRLVVVTRGSRGAVLATANERVEVAARAVQTIDTVGAGDSFMSALISAVVRLDSWEPGASDLAVYGDWAVHAAAITVSREGADPPTESEMPTLDSPRSGS